jgi:hypothetical protein
MIIISCDKARILFVTDTIADVLKEPADSWLGTTLYDLLHPKDIQKVKEQLTSFDVEEGMGHFHLVYLSNVFLTALNANNKQNSAKCKRNDDKLCTLHIKYCSSAGDASSDYERS